MFEKKMLNDEFYEPDNCLENCVSVENSKNRKMIKFSEKLVNKNRKIIV